ncbi:DUF952 domain-containing protein [Paracoccus sp. S-4012]|uniref:DUF952 domain-containing protein n=1 Tax=Paracoccus sp. S-4012 TaxID=2665648 RepID=UPI0012AFFFE8|nr:DUF952 domain-containing protein [Paracoccus sp. S-4012]MRX51132.1 DUF952 domain-containing protein [Paracoccus sp. S-4012]
MLIYKIFRPAEFAELIARGESAGAPVDRADGFVHFSTGEQVRETAARHFSGEDGLWLLACDGAGLGPALRWEVSRGGAAFPHLYRVLRAADVVWARPLPLGTGGHRFGEDVGAG